MDNTCCGFLLQEPSQRIFLLIGSFWDEIRDLCFDLKWLFQDRNHFEKLERKLQET